MLRYEKQQKNTGVLNWLDYDCMLSLMENQRAEKSLLFAFTKAPGAFHACTTFHPQHQALLTK
jgi:hypothetical protein